MDLSLDEIIQKKKFVSKPNRKGFPIKNTKRIIGQSYAPPTKRVTDARLKIIQKNRAKIRDAREKLAQITKASGDARLRILKKRKDISPKIMRTPNNFRTKKLPISKLKLKYPPPAKLPQLIGVPRGYVDYDNMEMEEEYEPTSVNLRRTVHNDMIPPFGSYQSSERSSWNNDPFDCYETPVTRPPDVAELRRQIRNMSPDLIPPKSILRSNRQASPPTYSGRYISEQPSHLSYEMRSRLEHAPDPHASMGIFANPSMKHSSSLSSSSSSSTSGCRIVVSNLHSSVTQSDIKELFEDIGELHEARLVRPGVAEVIFKSIKDAEKAVDTYHNRQLDGQPMKCLLVHPRASNNPTAPAIKSSNAFSSSSNKTPLEIDIDALHKVLFRRN